MTDNSRRARANTQKLEEKPLQLYDATLYNAKSQADPHSIFLRLRVHQSILWTEDVYIVSLSFRNDS